MNALLIPQVLLFVAFCFPLKAQEDRPQAMLSPDALAAFEWCSTLDVPDVKELQPVKVWVGHADKFMLGFLEKAEGREFQIIGPLFSRQTFTETGEIPDASSRVRHEPFSMDEFLRWHGPLDRAMPLLEARQRESARILAMAEEELNPDYLARCFMLAWCCWRKERNDLAIMFLEPVIFAADAEKEKSGAIRRIVAPFLAWHFFRRIELQFRDRNITRPQLAERLKTYVSDFPGLETAENAARMLEHLNSLIAEEKDHPAPDPKAITALPPEKRAEIWAGQLRNQFYPVDGPEPSPMAELLKIGLPAVPALIPVLDDPRPTRAVFPFPRMKSWQPNHELKTIEELAKSLIGDISGITFHGHGASCRRDVEKWWEELQRKGERQYLLDAVVNGPGNAVELIRVLLAKYPADAGSAAVQAYSKLKDSQDKTSLIEVMRGVNHTPWTALLERELRLGATLSVRAYAAESLRKLQVPGAMEAMRDEWRKLEDFSDSEGVEGV